MDIQQLVKRSIAISMSETKTYEDQWYRILCDVRCLLPIEYQPLLIYPRDLDMASNPSLVRETFFSLNMSAVFGDSVEIRVYVERLPRIVNGRIVDVWVKNSPGWIEVSPVGGTTKLFENVHSAVAYAAQCCRWKPEKA